MKKYYVRVSCLGMLLLGHVFSAKAQEDMRLEWATSFKEVGIDTNQVQAGQDEGKAVVTDAEGNVYTAGSIKGDTVDFDPGPGEELLAAAGKEDIFVSKQGPDGTLIWAKRFGALQVDVARALALDNEGNLYVAGVFQETVDFDPGPGLAELVSMGGNDIFILKLSPAGEYIWAKRMGGPGADGPQNIDVDAAGNVYTAGNFSRTADFDPDPAANYDLTAVGPLPNMFISKLDPEGNFVWAKQVGPPAGLGLMTVASIRLAPSGQQVYLSGLFGYGSAFDFDPGAGTEILSPIGDFDIFLLKLDSAGQFGWAKQIGGTESTSGSIGMDLDLQENVYATGMFSGTVDFDPGPAIHPRTSPNSDMYISKLDSAGNFVWVTTTTGTSDSSMVEGNAIAVDAEGNAYVTGIFQHTVNFFSSGVSGDLSSTGANWNIFVAKVSASGGFEWAKQMGGQGLHQAAAYALSLDPTGEKLYLTGRFNETVDFDPGPDTMELVCGGTGVNGYDIFVAQYCVAKLEPIVSVNGFQLGTVDTYYSYQWLLGDQPIDGATERYYEVEANGDYRVVIVTEGGCVDTSDVYPVTNYTNNIKEINNIAAQIRVYPNPATDIVHIDAPVAVDVLISSVEGKLIREEKDARSISVDALAEGVYFLQVIDQQGQLIKVVKILKTR